MTTLADYVGHKLNGMAYLVQGNPFPARAVLATVTGTDGTGLVVRVDDDDLQGNATVEPIFEDELEFGGTPFTGELLECEEFGEYWELALDFWE